VAITNLPPNTKYRWPDATQLDPAEMLLSYDQRADMLSVAFGGKVRPAFNESLDEGPADYVMLRLDFDTEEVVGIEVEVVNRRALREHPTWRKVVEAATNQPRLTRIEPTAWPALTAFVQDVVDLSESSSN
jgi:hypothetical protein